MSWMKRRGQPSPNPTNPGVPMYNPNQHSNSQQPYQQWPQQPSQQTFNNDWYGQQQQQQKGPSKTPPTSQYPSNTNYWQQPSYNQSSQNFNTSIGHQNLSNLPQQQPINQYQQQQQQPQQQQQYNNQFPANQQQSNYYQNTNNYPQDNFIQQQYAQPQATQNFYQQQQVAATATPQLQQQQQQQQQVGNHVLNQQPADADPWNWDWEDNSNANSQLQVPPTQNEQPVNQNNITDSFANDESWNWSVEESSSSQSLSQKTETESINSAAAAAATTAAVTPKEEQVVENTIEYQTGAIDELPSLPNLRRIKNENLTPQWSIESQVSQDSSEDVLLTSESDNRSNILSQSSTTSHSPTRQPDHEFQHTSQMYRYDGEINQPVVQNVELNSNSEFYQENITTKNKQSYLESIDKGMEELNLNAQVENKEIVSPEGNAEEIKNQTPPLPAASSGAKKTVPSTIPPPQATSSELKNPYKKTGVLSNKSMKAKEPLIPNSQNMEPLVPSVFLQKTPSAFAQIRPTSSENISPRPESTENNLGVNLETVPDNSERPDVESVQKASPPSEAAGSKTARKSSTVQQQWAENCEIAPINDRNQYLETGQLSDTDIPVYNQSGNEYQMDTTPNTSVADANDSLPPPGLCRLVLGQMEQAEATQSNDNTLDAAPPPGLSRKVIGSTAPTYPNARARPLPQHMAQATDYSFNEEPPAGLHRMVPGESSSPESSSYMYQTDGTVFQAVNFDDADNYVSESELNQMGVNLVSQRSATIGADTPPVTNQQSLSNTGYSSSSSVDPTSSIPSREGAVGIDNDRHEKSDLTSNQTEESKPSSLPPENNRREDIDGGTEEAYISNVRDQTVGQNTTDGGNSSDKHRNRNYATDSEHEQPPKERHNRSSSPSSRYDKDRRYYEDRRDRHRDRDRDSPDRFRDRKYEKRRLNKDRRYEDETDYYSDKERGDRKVRDEREDYDGKRFNSLRRDKDRDRRREYDRSDYYLNNSRFEEDYYNRSRPSSRSDSMHDSYRERRHPERDSERSARHRSDRERGERDHHRRPRDPYNANYYQGYNYDPYHPYYQQYQYYEHLRRTNPQAYADLYRNYYQNQGSAVAHQPGYSTEDRASVHSGRSSANDELKKDRYTRQSYYSQQSLPHYYREIPNASSTAYTLDDSRLLDHTDSSLILEDSTNATQRLTPAKFSTAHIKASIASGNFINILPHYPVDGQPATVEIFCLQSILYEDEEQKELVDFPGPLIKGTTHKKTVIEYCENKIKRANNTITNDVDSYILMWELLILLLRQNGMVVGTDIAELLMKNRTFENNRRQSVSSSGSAQHLDSGHEQIEHHATRTSPAMHYKEEYITDKFREYLIYGSGKEALEWAMKHGLWGHALFLASKLDKRTYANVMMRFANGLTMNDPLQTLYQLLSGRQPAAVTSCADEKWGDWRPHLAMILSNTSQRPDLDRKAITTLGDTLQQRGNLYAAHFCYLMAQVEFGRYGSQANAKLVLLSSSHAKPFKAFATNEAIFMTEIYEYACSLSDATFNIPEFLPYKYIIATRMVDYGLLEKGLLYLERVAVNIKQDPSRTQPSLVSRVCQLADRLKYCDPIQDDGDLDSSKTEHTWLTELKNVLNDYDMGLITHQSATNLTSLEPDQQHSIQYDQQQQQQQQWQQQQQVQSQQQSLDYYQQQQPQIPNDEQQSWQQQQQPEQQSIDYNNQQQQQQPSVNYQEGELQQQTTYDSGNYQDQYWNQQNQTWDEATTNANQQMPQQIDDNKQQNDYWNSTAQPSEEPRPQISMPNQSKSKNYFDSDENDVKPTKAKSAAAPAAAKPASTGWFGGIWSKLALRPKNQMKLPDDKNPTIVWDSEKKRWVNLEEDNGETSTELKPPPKMSEMFNRTTPPQPQPPPPQMPQVMPNAAPSTEINSTQPAAENANNNETDKKPPSGANMFKLQRGRNIKKAYVDVFNPGSAKPTANKSSIPSPEVFGSALPVSAGNQMNFFVPQPIADPNAPTDFLTPPSVTQEENNAQISRWSSSSSLSREVQYYMQQRPRMAKAIGGAPMMYNPNQFSNVGQSGNYPTH